MDISAAFDPDFDGKRARALALYGVDAQFRASDEFVVALDRIVACAVHFTAGTGAAVALWPGREPVTFARAGTTVSDAELGRVWRSQSRRGDPRLSTARGDDVTTSVVGAAVLGHERLRLGLLVVTPPAGTAIDAPTSCLLETLAWAVTATLDERRRVVGRRRAPLPPGLRLMGGPDRRRGT